MENNHIVLVTGAAGFIGFHTVRMLIKRGFKKIIGIDNLNYYYDPALKQARLDELSVHKDIFHCEIMDISQKEALHRIFAKYKPDWVIHLAAQAGVRYSIDNPDVYVQSNLVGFVNILEAVRHFNVKHLVYASSSSVYGANTELPFAVSDRTDHQVSLYAATKKANESIAFSYSCMYQIPITGLRFFTVYGPYGRPDMAYFKFTKNMYEDKPITVYNNGNMMRDFTYIDDIVNGVIAAISHQPAVTQIGNYQAAYKLYNIGHNHPELLSNMIEILEELTGKKALKDYQPLQTGDVLSTYAYIDDIKTDLGFETSVTLKEGLSHFVKWYKSFYKV